MFHASYALSPHFNKYQQPSCMLEIEGQFAPTPSREFPVVHLDCKPIPRVWVQRQHSVALCRLHKEVEFKDSDRKVFRSASIHYVENVYINQMMDGQKKLVKEEVSRSHTLSRQCSVFLHCIQRKRKIGLKLRQ